MHPDLAKFQTKVRRLQNQVKRAVALDLYGTLIGPPPEGTPVDRAVARGSWHYGVNEIKTDVPARPPKGSKVKKPSARALPKTKVGDVVNISNSAPYIQRLNEGHSGQSPPGFIDDAVDRATATYGSLVERVKAETS